MVYPLLDVILKGRLVDSSVVGAVDEKCGVVLPKSSRCSGQMPASDCTRIYLPHSEYLTRPGLQSSTAPRTTIEVSSIMEQDYGLASRRHRR
jgi:hypothetical protein